MNGSCVPYVAGLARQIAENGKGERILRKIDGTVHRNRTIALATIDFADIAAYLGFHTVCLRFAPKVGCG
jgi:hypothetical protein